MFDNLKNLAGMAGVLKDLPKIQSKMEEVKERLGKILVTAETGGGAVRVTANGKIRVVSIEIEPALLGGLVDAEVPEDRAIAQELIAGAVNAALEKAKERAAAEFGGVAEELGFPIPPGVLGNLM